MYRKLLLHLALSNRHQYVKKSKISEQKNMVHICFDDETPPPDQIAVSSITITFC